MIDKQQVISLLAAGIPTSQIAAAVGCDDSYISQLRADPEIAAQVAEKSAATVVADAKFDELLDSAETKALEKIERSLQFANFQQALSAFRILNGAKRRKDPLPGAGEGTTINVHLTLPASAAPRYVKNANNEIIDVEGKTMISATAKTLDQILGDRAAGKQLPQTTALERAATMLETIKPMVPVAPRKLPAVLSPDIL